MLSKKFLLCLLTCATPLASAQSEDLDMTNKGYNNLTQAGKLFSVTADPKDTLFRFQVSGTEAAKIDFNKTEVVAEYGLGENKKTIVLTRVKDKAGETYFTLEKKEGGYDKLNLNISTGGKQEQIIFQDLK